MSDELQVGVINKYDVRRLNDATGKHDDCWFFVLDILHDPLARHALTEYAIRAKEAGYETLSVDLLRRIARVDMAVSS